MFTDINAHSILFSFIIVGSLNFLAVISPGPDFALLVKTALTQPRKPSLLTALGISLGILVHISYCILGLAIIITQSVFLFRVIKYVGATYFIYIGILGIFAKSPKNPSVSHPVHTHELKLLTAFKRGFLCNLLNPKATLFFLGLFTLVVKPSTPIWMQALYGLEMFLITFSWFSALAIIITHRKVKNKIGHFQYYITKLMGVLLLVFGIEIAFM